MDRIEIINQLIKKYNFKKYLEIGVRNDEECFSKIECESKLGVDPGYEFENPRIDYKMTSDEFFSKLENNELNLDPGFKWDIIFVDGLHISWQVKRDVLNSLNHLSPDGYIVLHDCNPLDIFHAREDYQILDHTFDWNGTVWKVIYWLRTHRKDLRVFVVDTDYGVGVVTKGPSETIEFDNEFYEFNLFNQDKLRNLNLISIDSFKDWIRLC
jgi:hypothetical protein